MNRHPIIDVDPAELTPSKHVFWTSDYALEEPVTIGQEIWVDDGSQLISGDVMGRDKDNNGWLIHVDYMEVRPR